MYWARIRELTNNMFNPMQINFNPETEWMLKWENLLWIYLSKSYVNKQFRYAFN